MDRHRFRVLLIVALLPLFPWGGHVPASARTQATDVCAAFPNGTLPDGTVWTADNSPYMVNCDLRVANAASSLTIQAGVQVLFATGKRFRVEGPLTVEGTGPDSVIFGSQQAAPQRGDWRGVEVQDGPGVVALSGLTIRHAGSPDNPALAALQIRRSGLTLTDVTVEDTSGAGVMAERIGEVTFKGLRVRRNVGAGLEVNENSSVKVAATLENSEFESNAEAVKAGAGVEWTLSGNKAKSNKLNALLIETSRVSHPLAWRGGDLPYVVRSTLYVEAALTVEPGTLVKFVDTTSNLRISKDGLLTAVGTADRKITFTALGDDSTCSSAGVDCDTGSDGPAAPGPGAWSTLEIGAGSLEGSRLSHVAARYGGAGGSTKAPMVEIERDGTTVDNAHFASAGGVALKVNDVSATITDSSFSGNGGDGIQIDATTPDTTVNNVVTVTGCRFEKNGGAAIDTDPNVVLRQSGNALTGPGIEAYSNGLNGIRVNNGSITRPITWQAGRLPYVVAGGAEIEVKRGTVRDAEGRLEASGLLIEPGAVVKMGAESALVNTGGTMQIGPPIDGVTGLYDTAASQVLITSLLDDACAAGSTETCDTGGDGASLPRPGSWNEINLAGASRSTIARAVVRYGGAVGQRGAAIVIGHDKDEVRGTEVSHSEEAGILVTRVGAAFISDCTIHNNLKAGIRAEASTTQGLKLFLSGNTITDNPGPAIDTDANVAVALDTIDRAAGDSTNLPKPNSLERNAIDGVAVHGTVNVDRTWEPVGLNYYVTDDVYLAFGKTLTLKPGVQVRFQNTSLISEAGTRLVAVGTADNPVVFTSHNADGSSVQPGPGDWRGLVLGGCIAANDPSTCSRLQHVVIRYTGGAGARQDPAVRVTASGAAIANALIEFGTGDGIRFDNASGKATDTLIRKMSGDGISIRASGSGLINPDLSQTRVEECRSIVSMDAGAQPAVSGLSFARNQVNGIVVQGTISRQGQVRWGRSVAPYVLHANDVQVGANASLLIDAGTVVKAQGGATLRVERSGALLVPAPGSGTDPVHFTSLRDDSACTDLPADAPDRQYACDTNSDGADSLPGPGDWAGIEHQTLATSLSFDGVTVDYAGQEGQAIMLEADRAVIRNSRIRWSRGDGVVVDVPGTVATHPLEFRDNLVEGSQERGLVLSGQWQPNTYRITIANNRFVRNLRSVEHRAKSPTEFTNNVAVGNVNDAMLYCSDVNIIQTWSNDLVRELDCSLGVTQALTLVPGSVLMMDKSGLISVEGAGKLEADGVVITADEPTAGAGHWAGVRFARGNVGGGHIRNSVILHGGSGQSGAVNVSAESPVIRILNNLILRTEGIGLQIGATANEKVEIAGNILPEVSGVSSAVIRAENGARPYIHHNRLAGAQVGILVRSDAKPKVEMNGFARLAKAAIENTETDVCIEAGKHWWGDATGPLDNRRNQNDPCGRDIINEKGKGLPITDGVRYQPWLAGPVPAAPLLDAPHCGTTNQSRVTVQGVSSAEAMIQAYDGDTPLGSPVRADSDGRFSFELNLAEGEHRLTFDATQQQPTSDGQSLEARSPRSGFRRVVVDGSSRIDPMRVVFSYGDGAQARAQAVRDASGCAVACGAFSGGRVSLPPQTEVTVSVPVNGNPASVTFAQPGSEPLALRYSAATGLWESAPFLPKQDTYDILVDGAPSGACSGFLYVGETGVIFSDSGVQAPLTIDEDFESGSMNDWVANGGGWAVSSKEGEDRFDSGKYVLTDSPNADYGTNLDTTVTYVYPIDMLQIPSPVLVFWHKYRFAAGDSGILEVNSLGAWKAVKTFTGNSVISGQWKAEAIPLDAFARDNQVQIRFRLRSDGRENTRADGWTIDDISLGSGGRGNGRYDRVQAGEGTSEPAVDDALVTLYRRDPDTGAWSAWKPAPGSTQVNPQLTDAEGRYGFYSLPVGEYRVAAESRKYGVRQTEVIPVWDGTFAREIPILAGEPIYLPSIRKGQQ